MNNKYMQAFDKIGDRLELAYHLFIASSCCGILAFVVFTIAIIAKADLLLNVAIVLLIGFCVLLAKSMIIAIEQNERRRKLINKRIKELDEMEKKYESY